MITKIIELNNATLNGVYNYVFEWLDRHTGNVIRTIEGIEINFLKYIGEICTPNENTFKITFGIYASSENSSGLYDSTVTFHGVKLSDNTIQVDAVMDACDGDTRRSDIIMDMFIVVLIKKFSQYSETPALSIEQPSQAKKTQEVPDDAIVRFGTDNDLSLFDVKVIVERCNNFTRMGGKITEFCNQYSGGKYEVGTLRRWLRDTRFTA